AGSAQARAALPRRRSALRGDLPSYAARAAGGAASDAQEPVVADGAETDRLVAPLRGAIRFGSEQDAPRGARGPGGEERSRHRAARVTAAAKPRWRVHATDLRRLRDARVEPRHRDDGAFALEHEERAVGMKQFDCDPGAGAKIR